MTNILIRSFPSLDNYGTGMMGLIAIHRLAAMVAGPVTFHCDLEPGADIGEVRAELGLVPGSAEDARIAIVRSAPNEGPPRDTLGGLAQRAWMQAAGPTPARGMDLVVVLGGDDLSEYYTNRAWMYMAAARRWATDAPVVFLGHTIGPFRLRRNRLAARTMLPAIHIFPRDRWCTGYLQAEFGLGARLKQSTDLAYGPLPQQHRDDIRDAVLAQFGLEPDRYGTMVVSGLQGKKYYTADKALYLDRHAEMVAGLLALPAMAGKRLCLLAHTFGRNYGHEPDFIEAVLPRLAPEVRARVVPVTERVLQTRARFILGHGLFTITGRMHPAVSTFQMGRPAITLAYSKKYEGVIGTMLGRSDLIIEANDSALWESGAIVGMAVARVGHALADETRLRAEIAAAIAEQERAVDATFETISRLLPGAADGR